LILTAVLSVCFSAPVFSAERETWVLAAEPFSTKDVPEVYQTHAEVLPRMLLSYLGRISARNVLPDETQSRKLQELNDSRIQYLLERNELEKSRDVLLLSDATRASKKKSRRDLDKKIEEKNVLIAETEEAILRQKNEDKIVEESLKDLVLWKDGKELYKPMEKVSLARSLAKDGISGLVSGTIEDIGGYLLISVTLDTGYGKTRDILFREAMPYDGVEEILGRLTARLVPELSNRRPVTVTFSIEPPEAKLFIDERLVPDHTVPATLFSGEHAIQVSAPDYETAERTASFDTLDRYTVSVALKPLQTVIVAFETGERGADVFFETRHFGTTSFTAEIPAKTLIGEALHGDARTYFINEYTDTTEGTRSVIIPVNRVNTEQRIERQRKVLYWSLGLLYCSLPVSMISRGIAMNKMQAYNDGRIEPTQENIDEINNWVMVSDISRGVSIALGVNFLFQLVRYLIAADQTIPKYTIEHYKE